MAKKKKKKKKKNSLSLSLFRLSLASRSFDATLAVVSNDSHALTLPLVGGSVE